MKKQSNNSIDYYILPNKILCTTLGISLSDKKRSLCGQIFAYLRLFVAVASISSFVVPQAMLLFIKWNDLKILSEVGGILTTLAQFEFKLIYLAIRREKTYKLYKEVRSLWNSTDDPEEKRSYEEFAYWARRFTIIFYSFGTWTTVIYTASAAVDCIIIQYSANNDTITRSLPFDVWYGTNVSESPSFEIMFTVQTVSAIYNSAAIWGIETSCMTAILHVSGQFKLIKTWINNIGVKIKNEPKDHYYKCPPDIEDGLVRCIRHHQRLVNVVNELNDLLIPIIFIQLLTSGIKICLSGFAVMNNNTNAELIKAVLYLFGMTTQLLLYCYPGEILIRESEEVGDAAYLNVYWYKLPPSNRRQLLLTILRAQKCCSITAVTFQRLSFRTLTGVFNTAASYFTLLRQMQETSI
ncbi:odorant receptor 10-like [Megachile rotundata]|uniref:odorant receptor 10-like n=1 Tax=Megachile rotundata TaxID=143995 RepID=UPI003FD328F5